jgi:hypothetical protein
MKRIRTLRRMVVVVALAATLAAAMTGTAAAADGNVAMIDCAVLDQVYYHVPAYASPAHYSVLYVSLDGGDWQQVWYWVNGFTKLRWDPSYGWGTVSGTNDLVFNIGGGHTVVAWEYRLYPSGAGEWKYAGDCTTLGIGGGIIYTQG